MSKIKSGQDFGGIEGSLCQNHGKSSTNHIQYLVEHVRKYKLQKMVSRRFSVILTQAALYSTEVLSRFDFAQYLLESAVIIQRKIFYINDDKIVEKNSELDKIECTSAKQKNEKNVAKIDESKNITKDEGILSNNIKNNNLKNIELKQNETFLSFVEEHSILSNSEFFSTILSSLM